MKLQKIMGLALAGTMLFAAAPVFADDTGGNVDLTATATAATLKVTMPSAPSLVINPYHLKATLGTGSTYEQILSTPSQVKYLSNTPVKVSATVTATLTAAAPKAKLATAAVDAGDTGNNMYIAARFSEDQNLLGSGTVADVTTWSENPTVASAKGTKYDNDVAFPATADTNAGSEKAIYFKLEGSCSDSAAVAWTATDEVKVAVAFTFVSQPMELANIEVTGSNTGYSHSVEVLGVVVGDKSVIGAKDTTATAIKVNIVPATGKKSVAGKVTATYTKANADGTTTENQALAAATALPADKTAGQTATAEFTLPNDVAPGTTIKITIDDDCVTTA